MTTEDYRRALDSAIREYEELGQQRQDIDKRLSELGHSISNLARLCGLTPTLPWGLTDACRTVLRNAGLPMTPVEIRDRLQSIGVDLSKYSSDLAAIHTTLKRLNEAGEARFLASPGSKRSYVWNKPPRASGLGPEIAQFVRESIEREAAAKPASSRGRPRRGAQKTKDRS